MRILYDIENLAGLHRQGANGAGKFRSARCQLWALSHYASVGVLASHNPNHPHLAKNFLREDDVLGHLELPVMEAERGSVQVKHTNWRGNMTGICRGIPTVQQVYDLIALEHPEWFEPSKVKGIREYMVTSLERLTDTDGVVVHSFSVRQDVLERFPLLSPSQVHVVPLASTLVTNFAFPSAVHPGSTIPGWTGRPYVLSVATMDPRKNLLRLAEAFLESQAALAGDADLILVGDHGWMSADDRTALSSLMNRGNVRGSVRHLGRVNDEVLASLYANARLFAYPSLAEGFGLPLVEAMGFGCPVLTSDQGSMREIADGAGLLIDPRSVEAITEGLDSALTDRVNQELRRGSVDRSQRFSWQRHAKELQGVYEEIATRTGVPQAKTIGAVSQANHPMRKRDLLKGPGWKVAEEPAEAHEELNATTLQVSSVNENEWVLAWCGSGSRWPKRLVDVGAHWGTVSQLFAAQGWEVLALEPDPENRSHLERKLGGNPRVQIDARAVGPDQSEPRTLYTSHVSSGISTLQPFHETHSPSAEVPVVSLTRILKERLIRRVDFLKVDVEGFDLSVLASLDWSTWRPSVVTAEFEDRKTSQYGTTSLDVAYFLKGNGYSVYVSEWWPIVEYGREHQWRRLYPLGTRKIPSDSWGNFIAFREDPGWSAFAEVVRGFCSIQSAVPATPETSSTVANLARTSAESSAVDPAPSARSMKKHDDAVAGQDEVISKNSMKSVVEVVDNVIDGDERFLVVVLAENVRGLALSLKLDDEAVQYTALKGTEPFSVAIKVPSRISRSLRQLEISCPSGAIQPEVHRVYISSSKNWNPTRIVSTVGRLRRLQMQLLRHKTRRLPLELFDGIRYLEAYEDVREAVLAGVVDSALEHFVKRGNMEDRNFYVASDQSPNVGTVWDLELKNFDGVSYADQHPDVRSAVLSGKLDSCLDHYITRGRDEGRKAPKVPEKGNAGSVYDLTVRDLASLVESVSGRVDGLASGVESVSGRVDGLASGVESVSGRVDGLASGVESVSGRVDGLGLLEGQSRELLTTESLFRQSVILSRSLSSHEEAELLTSWTRLLGITLTRHELVYRARRVIELERRSRGRLATTLTDVLLRAMVVEAAAKRYECPVIVEIGTLFGLGYTCIADQLMIKDVEHKGILIDPLDGYYGQTTDRTGEKVSEEVLRENLATLGPAGRSVSIVKSLSDNSMALEAVRSVEQGIAVLIVDGDHTLYGAARDLILYSEFVPLGGFVLVDDYDVPEWAGVTQATDQFLSDNNDFVKLGTLSRTAVLQRIR